MQAPPLVQNLIPKVWMQAPPLGVQNFFPRFGCESLLLVLVNYMVGQGLGCRPLHLSTICFTLP
eukprot:5474974-Karenia_brevis.AAC.1